MMVTADELTQIQRRMAEAGITNAGAYMRKMALFVIVWTMGKILKRRRTGNTYLPMSATRPR